MKVGQVLTQWFQDLMAGRLRTPQAIVQASRAETPDPAQSSDRFFNEPQDGFIWDVPKRLSAPHFILSDAHIRQWDCADWQQVDLRLMRWSAVFIELARKRGIPLYVHCAMRTEAEQAKVNAAGNSKVPYPRSAHNIGEAVDIVHGVFHWTLTEREWAMLHVLGLRALDLVNRDLKKIDKLHLAWGGHFKTLYDPAHWEITDYRARVKRLPLGPPVRRTPRAILRDRRPLVPPSAS